jgi:hypothetical protein
VADGLSEIWRSALDANVRYYEAWGRAANEYLRELKDALKGYSPVVRLPTIQVPVATNAVVNDHGRAAAVVSPSEPPATPVVVLEAAPGHVATGAVLVQNHLLHPVSAAVAARVHGHDGSFELAVEPDRVELAPGEAAVVRVRTTIPEDGPPIDVRGELLVPELVGTTVGLVVRSRPGAGPADSTG